MDSADDDEIKVNINTSIAKDDSSEEDNVDADADYNGNDDSSDEETDGDEIESSADEDDDADEMSLASDAESEQGLNDEFPADPLGLDNQSVAVNSPIGAVEVTKQFLLEHASITNNNALLINQQLQTKLKALRDQLETMLQSCRNKYVANENHMRSCLRRQSPVTGAIKRHDNRQTSLLFYGAPFFKTIQGFAAPYNKNYLQRRRNGEFLPIDIAVLSNRWSTNDKVHVIHGVREQVVQRLRLQDAQWQRSNGTACSASARRQREQKLNVDLGIKRLADLMKMIDDKSFCIDWYTVAQKHLDGRHKHNECEAIWMATLRPELRRDPWTPDEEKRLTEAAVRYDSQNWEAIAAEMDRRSVYQCLVQFRTKLFDNTQKQTGRWSADEDALLLRLVKQCRDGVHISWNVVATRMPGRSLDQCYNRYKFSLQPDIKHDKFTVEEDCILLAGHKQHGFNIEKYMHLLPGRTRVQIRNRYNNVLRFEKKPEQWTEELDRRLMEMVDEHGENWSLIAQQLDSGHARQSVRSRVVRIRKHLVSRPDATLAQMPRRRVQHSARTRVTKENWMDTLMQLKTDERTTTDKLLRLKTNNGSNRANSAQPATQQTLAEYMRYAYRLRLEMFNIQPDSAITMRTETVCRALRSQVCPLDYRLLHATPKDTIDVQCLPELDIDKSQLLQLPPSWCTALVLRGLAIMFPNVRCQSDLNSDSDCVGQRPIVERIEPLQLFRQRFRSLLFNTAMMTQVQFSEPELPEQLNGSGSSSGQSGNHLEVPTLAELSRRYKSQNKPAALVRKLKKTETLKQQNTKELQLKTYGSKRARLSKGQTLSEYLRYSYRLRLEPFNVDPDSLTNLRTETISRALRSQVCPMDYRLLHATTRETIDIQCLPELDAGQSPLQLLLPPSWCTVLVLRGLAMMFPTISSDVNTDDDSSDVNQPSTMERAEELQLFRQRFRALLLNTALMTRMKTIAEPLQTVNTNQQLQLKVARKRSLPAPTANENEQAIESSFILDTEQGMFRVDVIKRQKRNTEESILS